MNQEDLPTKISDDDKDIPWAEEVSDQDDITNLPDAIPDDSVGVGRTLSREDWDRVLGTRFKSGGTKSDEEEWRRVG